MEKLKKENKRLKRLNYSNRKIGGTVNLNDFVTTSKSECADHLNKKKGEPCSSCTIVDAIVQFTEALGVSNTKIKDKSILSPEIQIAAEVLQCDSESCVISHPKFKKFAISNHIVNKHELENQLVENFKIQGPKETTTWLNNEDIDFTLKEWEKTFTEFGFFPCPFAMIDFDKTREPLHKHNLVDIYTGKINKKCYKTFGCAINTDVHTGNGKHWMALFVDMRSDIWTIEFFNSSGRPPAQSIVNWMARTAEYLKQFKNNSVEIIYVTNIEHQQSNTECGMYTLFYIRSRLEGKSYQLFLSGERISDESMIEFRKHCFR